MKNSNITKINSLGKAGKILSVILFAVSAIGTALFAAAAFSLTVAHKDITEFSGILAEKFNTVPDDKLSTLLSILFVIAFFIMLTTAIMLVFAAKLCKKLEKCETPFSEDVTNALRNFAVSAVPWAVVSVSAGGVSVIGIVFVVIMILLFSAAFRHGAELQIESDETL